MDKKKLGEKIRTVRKGRRLTGERLSEMCNINATYMRQIESGMKIPSLPVFVTICRSLEVSPAYLLADSVGEDAMSECRELTELFRTATPQELKLVTVMMKAVLEELRKSTKDSL